MSHKIKFGDTLSSLARRFGTSVESLAKANGIRDVNRIYAGDSLKLPGDARSTRAANGRMGGYAPAGAFTSQTYSAGNVNMAGASDAAKRVLEQAMRFVGQPYQWGGGHGRQMDGPGPVDCSGLIQQASGLAGVGRSGTAATFQDMGSAVSMQDLKPGDLVFRGNPANHVGIYVGDGKVLHAPQPGERVCYVNADYFESARRVF
jgi:cell wall-associated NlpC family hydrolase